MADENVSRPGTADPADAAAQQTAAEPNAIEFRISQPTQPRGSESGARKESKEAEPDTKTEKVARGSPAAAGQRTAPIPDAVLDKFIKVGNHFYFPDGAEAFTDHGSKMTTTSENAVVIQSMVAIARERAKDAIAVTGTEFFRREAWFAAKLAGLEVRGYEPTTLEQERLVRSIARRQQLAAQPPSAAAGVEGVAQPKGAAAAQPAAEGELLVGRLVDYGPARFERNAKNDMNYYVRLETSRGEIERWGVDLERAFQQSLSRPGLGDEVGLRVVGQDRVIVRNGNEDLHTHRNQWIVERKDFLDQRAEMAALVRDQGMQQADAVKRHPELEGSYYYLETAQEWAQQQYRSAGHRRQFLNHVREYLATSIEQGKPLEPVPVQSSRKSPEPQIQDRDYAPTR